MAKKTVLIADSHSLVSQGLGEHISDWLKPCALEYFSDGQACVERVKRRAPDLLVLDLPLARLDGLSVIEQVKWLSPTTPIVLLTSAELVTTWLEAYNVGADAVVTKFAKVEVFRYALMQVMAGKRFFLNGEIDPYAVGQVSSEMNAVLKPKARRLNPVECKILRLLAAGYASADIADTLGISHGMVAMYKHIIKTKLNLATTPQLVKYAKETGITKLLLQQL